MSHKYAPIVLFVYARSDHTQKTIEALKRNTLAKESDLFIFSDGAKNEKTKEGVVAVREYVRSVTGFRKVEIYASEENRGLAESIQKGVTEIVNTYGKVIVLEDDIVTSPLFLEYMNNALEVYENEEKVMHVSGYFLPGGETLPTQFFYNQGFCWGWATWKRSWDYFTSDTEACIHMIEGSLDWKSKMYLRNALSQLYANKAGTLKTWAAKWQACITGNGGYCLQPNISYVVNIGNDGSGEHCADTDVFSTVRMNSSSVIQLLPLVEDKDAIRTANVFFKKIKPSFLQRLLARLRRHIK